MNALATRKAKSNLSFLSICRSLATAIMIVREHPIEQIPGPRVSRILCKRRLS